MNGLASRPWLIVPVCAAMHVTFALGYLVDPNTAHITALHTAYTLFGWTLPVVCLLAAGLAICPMLAEMSPLAIHLSLWPQQFLLFLMTYSAIKAAWAGTYPDGYKNTFTFIYTDQCLGMYVMLGHLAAVLRNARLLGK